MAYRIDPAEPTDVELRRVVREQLTRAVDVLRRPDGPDAEGVHEVRKRLKKARSALRLGRADFGPRVRHHANDELRRVGNDLSDQRDADAQVEAVESLLAVTDDAGPDVARHEALGEVRRILVEQAEDLRITDPLGRATVIGAARTLDQTAGWLARVEPQCTGWDALAAGLAREYGRGRDALADPGEEANVDDLHEWRKRVKDLWYHERLLRDLWPDVQKSIVTVADEVADLLGQDHDLGLLIARLAPPGEHAPADVRSIVDDLEPLDIDPEVRHLVTGAARDRRADLQARARWIGGRLYADRPKAWTRRHGAWWALAQPVHDNPVDPAGVEANA